MTRRFKIATLHIMLLLVGCAFLSSCGSESEKVEIQMQKVGGVYQVPCKVNDVPMDFIFDTGASNVCISLTEASFLYKQKRISSADLKGSTWSQLADGSIVPNTSLNLKTLEIGGIKIHDVDAIVTPSQTAPLLLGQSALKKFVDYTVKGDTLYITPPRQEGSCSESNSSFFKEVLQFFKQLPWWGWLIFVIALLCGLFSAIKTEKDGDRFDFDNFSFGFGIALGIEMLLVFGIVWILIYFKII